MGLLSSILGCCLITLGAVTGKSELVIIGNMWTATGLIIAVIRELQP